jgi:hypothetical protein
LGQVNRKPDPQKNVVELNLTPEPEPVGFCVGFGCLSGFFRVSFEFRVFFYFFGFLSGSEFFWVSNFFGFQAHPRVKNKTRTQTQFCAGWVQIQVTGAKMHLNPHRQV